MSSSSSSSSDYLIPFRSFLPAESSTFEVPVPLRYLDGRKFHFENLSINPQLFNKAAAGYGVEAQEEGLVIYRSDVRLDCDYVGEKKNFFPSSYKPSSAVAKARDFVQEFNAFFEREKPDFMKKCPLFFDWTDLRIVDAEADYAVAAAKAYDQVWFNEAFSLDEHGNGLPESLKTMRGVNHLRYPADGKFSVAQMNEENFRIRLFVAPFVKATFSVLGPLQELGFTASQFGEQSAKRQITIVNSEPFYTEFTALTAPKIELSSTVCTVNVLPAETAASSFSRTLEISAKDFKDNAALASQLNAKIGECADELNVNFSLKYNESEKKFLFSFPSSQDRIVLSLHLQKPELSLRLGYFHTNLIQKESEAHEVKDGGSSGVSETDVFNKCKALCFDTGLVLCTLDQMSSNSTSGVLDACLASLFPHKSGVMRMTKYRSCPPPGVVLTSFSGSSAEVLFTFRLLRIYDNQEIRKFAWKDGAYVDGTLVGIRKENKQFQ